MSRIGRKPIILPKGVKVSCTNNRLSVEGPKGKLSCPVTPHMKIEAGADKLSISMNDTPGSTSALHGLTWALANNMVQGVSTGWSKTLEIVGVGFHADMKGKDLELTVGYSHVVKFTPPEGVTFKTDGPTKVIVEGIDRQKVGQTAAEIRDTRLPEPYKGKGIKYDGEHIRRKAGKTAV